MCGSKDRPQMSGDLQARGRNGSPPRCRQMVGALRSAVKIDVGMARQMPPTANIRQCGEPPGRELGGFPPFASQERARLAARSKLLRTPKLAYAWHVSGVCRAQSGTEGAKTPENWQSSIAEAMTRAGKGSCRRERARATAMNRLRRPKPQGLPCGCAPHQAAKLADDWQHNDDGADDNSKRSSERVVGVRG